MPQRRYPTQLGYSLQYLENPVPQRMGPYPSALGKVPPVILWEPCTMEGPSIPPHWQGSHLPYRENPAIQQGYWKPLILKQGPSQPPKPPSWVVSVSLLLLRGPIPQSEVLETMQ